MNNFFIYVFFDVYNKKTRTKVAEKCKDYGLSKVQYYLFSGYLTKKRIENLKKDITTIIGNTKIMLLIFPLCDNCINNLYVINTKRKIRKDTAKEKSTKVEFGMKLNRKFLEFED
jgi:CRISPR-associated protein Cas2